MEPVGFEVEKDELKVIIKALKKVFPNLAHPNVTFKINDDVTISEKLGLNGTGMTMELIEGKDDGLIGSYDIEITLSSELEFFDEVNTGRMVDRWENYLKFFELKPKRRVVAYLTLAALHQIGHLEFIIYRNDVLGIPMTEMGAQTEGRFEVPCDLKIWKALEEGLELAEDTYPVDSVSVNELYADSFMYKHFPVLWDIISKKLPVTKKKKKK